MNLKLDINFDRVQEGQFLNWKLFKFDLLRQNQFKQFILKKSTKRLIGTSSLYKANIQAGLTIHRKSFKKL